jgi:hypothetical protein
MKPIFVLAFVLQLLLWGRLNGQPLPARPRIQVAILLDVSNSMDGLIKQAKGQLWNMVKVLGRVECNHSAVPIEIALYEYGRSSNNPDSGYVRQISAFSKNLDSLFKDLYQLTTGGGEEYCGHAIYSSVTQLKWDTASRNYRVIFIAGNESFLQGSLHYKSACEAAIKKGIIVNTIYCGDKENGIREYWDRGAACMNGSYTWIDKDAKEEMITTPYDNELFLLKEKLNDTYIAFGETGKQNRANMIQSDTVAVHNLADPGKISQYIVVKADKNLYNNASWDLVDAYAKNKNIIDKVALKTLPDSMQLKNRKQLKALVEVITTKRANIQQQIAALGYKRDAYVLKEKNKSGIAGPQTLETEIERIIRQQIKRFNMTIPE